MVAISMLAGLALGVGAGCILSISSFALVVLGSLVGLVSILAINGEHIGTILLSAAGLLSAFQIGYVMGLLLRTFISRGLPFKKKLIVEARPPSPTAPG